MCQPTRCQTCGKTTWKGCGRHIEQVRASVLPGDWCPGNHPGVRQTSWWRRLLGLG